MNERILYLHALYKPLLTLIVFLAVIDFRFRGKLVIQMVSGMTGGEVLGFNVVILLMGLALTGMILVERVVLFKNKLKLDFIDHCHAKEIDYDKKHQDIVDVKDEACAEMGVPKDRIWLYLVDSDSLDLFHVGLMHVSKRHRCYGDGTIGVTTGDAKRLSHEDFKALMQYGIGQLVYGDSVAELIGLDDLFWFFDKVDMTIAVYDKVTDSSVPYIYPYEELDGKEVIYQASGCKEPMQMPLAKWLTKHYGRNYLFLKPAYKIRYGRWMKRYGRLDDEIERACQERKKLSLEQSRKVMAKMKDKCALHRVSAELRNDRGKPVTDDTLLKSLFVKDGE